MATEPLTTAATAASSAAGVTLGTAGAALPVITIFGVSLGLRPELLATGFLGALVAMLLLNSVPGEGDTWRAMMRTAWRRIGVAFGSSLVAAHAAPLAPLALEAAWQKFITGSAPAWLDSVAVATAAAFWVGVFALPLLQFLRRRVGGKAGATPTQGGAS